MKVYLDNQLLLTADNKKPLALILSDLGFASDGYYLTSNGRRIAGDGLFMYGKVHIIPRVLGGKGGFGSMLRAIGAQIEKTTNREACRDLSGRRLRDINEEKRLKNWIAAQADREKEAAERKQKKLEKLCQEPKHEFKDETYDQLRSVLPEKVEDAVTQGLKASCSSKRKLPATSVKEKKKKRKLWVDDEIGSSDDDDSEDEVENSNTLPDKDTQKDESTNETTDTRATDKTSLETRKN